MWEITVHLAVADYDGVLFMLSFFPRDVLDEILNSIESVSEDFPTYSLENLSFDFTVIIILDASNWGTLHF